PTLIPAAADAVHCPPASDVDVGRDRLPGDLHHQEAKAFVLDQCATGIVEHLPRAVSVADERRSAASAPACGVQPSEALDVAPQRGLRAHSPRAARVIEASAQAAHLRAKLAAAASEPGLQ